MAEPLSHWDIIQLMLKDVEEQRAKGNPDPKFTVFKEGPNGVCIWANYEFDRGEFFKYWMNVFNS